MIQPEVICIPYTCTTHDKLDQTITDQRLQPTHLVTMPFTHFLRASISGVTHSDALKRLKHRLYTNAAPRVETEPRTKPEKTRYEAGCETSVYALVLRRSFIWSWVATCVWRASFVACQREPESCCSDDGCDDGCSRRHGIRIDVTVVLTSVIETKLLIRSWYKYN